MDSYLGSIARFIVPTLMIFSSWQRSEAISWDLSGGQPSKPTNVVQDGVQNINVNLEWRFVLDAGETLIGVAFERQNRTDAKPTQIASRLTEGFTVPKYNNEYAATNPATLTLLNVNNNEEYTYIIVVTYRKDNQLHHFRDNVEVIVYVPPRITKAPERKSEVNVGQTLTLTCNASGDPTPNITWTKDGVPQAQFNDSGYTLRLVSVQREDVGSYRCNANNEYGTATSTAIVTVKCPQGQCQELEVGINITSVEWKDDFENKNSVEYMMLKFNVSSAIASLYTLPQNAEKQFFELTILEFRRGSTIAVVRLKFQNGVSDPLKPLQDDVKDGNLGQFKVAAQLNLNPSMSTSFRPFTSGQSNPITSPTPGGVPTGSQQGTTSSNGGLTGAQIGGIVGGSIAFVVILIIIGLVFFFRNQKNNAGKSFSEADGYRMNRQPPPSGLGTASPAYVEARMFAPAYTTKRQIPEDTQNDAEKRPLPAGGVGTQNVAEKRPLPAGGVGGGEDDQGGFEMWC